MTPRLGQPTFLDIVYLIIIIIILSVIRLLWPGGADTYSYYININKIASDIRLLSYKQHNFGCLWKKWKF